MNNMTPKLVDKGTYAVRAQQHQMLRHRWWVPLGISPLVLNIPETPETHSRAHPSTLHSLILHHLLCHTPPYKNAMRYWQYQIVERGCYVKAYFTGLLYFKVNEFLEPLWNRVLLMLRNKGRTKEMILQPPNATSNRLYPLRAQPVEMSYFFLI